MTRMKKRIINIQTKKLKELVEEKGLKYIQENFQYSILETFTDDASDEYIIARESFWKEVLLTRIFGYNANWR